MSPLDSEWLKLPAPAKLNLFLQIVGRRADGYHLLQTVFQLLDWGDDVCLRVRSDGEIRRVSALVGVAPEHDLAVRAARLLQGHAETSLGADIEVHKRIPMGGGLGGGSSDAASVLVGLNALWRLGLNEDRLAELGLQLGADVPVFVRGHTAWAEGVGEILTPLALDARWFLVVDPGVNVPTAVLFQAPELTRDSAVTTISGFLSGRSGGNAFQSVLAARSEAVAGTLEALSFFGSPQLSGSGACCFVAFEREDVAAAAFSRWCAGDSRRRGASVLARGVNVSPLRASVQGWGVAKR
jgi:4-diphosphocytidyl-2-C-methyl-D-erythritol kinase